MSEAGNPTPEEVEAPPRETRRSADPTILVVDDDTAVRGSVATALRSMGYEVAVAGGGRDALRLVYGDTPTPALLLTDIEMPGMTGIELAARLKADRPDLHVILMTGQAASVERARGHGELVEAVLHKPFAIDVLRAAVRQSIGDPSPR